MTFGDGIPERRAASLGSEVAPSIRQVLVRCKNSAGECIEVVVLADGRAAVLRDQSLVQGFELEQSERLAALFESLLR